MSLSVKDVDFGEQNVIYVQSVDKEKSIAVDWTAIATETLLKILKKHMRLFEDGRFRTKKELFEDLSSIMERRGLFYSGPQCENKWKSLKRGYLNKHERTPSRRYPSKVPYESQIEDVLKIERPGFKKEIDTLNTVNLNIPPGFSKTKEEPLSESEGEEFEDGMEPEYTQQDEKLVQMMLRDEENASDDTKKNVCNDSDNGSYSNDDHNYSNSVKRKNQDRDKLSDEMRDLKKIVKKNFDSNTELHKNHITSQEQLTIFLDSLDKKEEEKIELKKKKLEKQGEIVQQLKIQNSLIAKLIQKLGNK